MQLNGTITNVRKEQKTSRQGKPFTISHITVEGFSEEINVGWDKGYAVGQTFNKEVAQNEWNQWEISKGGSGTATPANNKTVTNMNTPRGKLEYPVPADSGQNVIINQNSMSHATALVNGMLGELDFKSPNSELEDELDYRLGLALAIAPKITSFSSGRATLERVNEILKEQEVA